MRTAKEWFDAYGVSHQNKTNVIIHKICVPLILWSILGILWTIPTPEIFYSYGLNWSYVLMFLAMCFYISLKSIKVIAVVLIQVIPMTYAIHFAYSQIGHRLLYLSLIVFVISWIGQFIGHKIEGKKPSFLEDIQFLLIGPAWVFNWLIKL